MADLHFPAELPLQCVRELVAAVRAGDYTSTETVDHAIYATGCCNALRGGLPTPFGATPDDVAGKSDTGLCDAIESELPEGFGSTGDASAVSPVLVSMLLDLAFRVLRRFLDR